MDDFVKAIILVLILITYILYEYYSKSTTNTDDKLKYANNKLLELLTVSADNIYKVIKVDFNILVNKNILSDQSSILLPNGKIVSSYYGKNLIVYDFGNAAKCFKTIYSANYNYPGEILFKISNINLALDNIEITNDIDMYLNIDYDSVKVFKGHESKSLH
jgi:hypothetical protein